MNHQQIRKLLLKTGRGVCDKVYRSLQSQQANRLSQVVQENAEDTIYAIDKEVEDIILPILVEKAEALGGIRLIAEGMGNEGELLLPEGISATAAAICIIMDPIDGTRGIMYDKRSAFFLAAAAPNREKLCLQDIELSVMVELPTSKAYLSDAFYASRGGGCQGERLNLHTQEVTPLLPRPSKADSIIGGFAQISRFFPPGKDILASIEEEMIKAIAPIREGKALLFEDQYISSGGQLYEMLMGHDRFTADLRTALYQELAKKNETPAGLCCHPYDVCATLIGEEAGLIITNIEGKSLNPALNLTEPVDWVGYANERIRLQVEPVLQLILQRLNWI
ncbi:MAG: inositol monophosphatase family protein [Cyclobacteriaceae bacterium]